MSLRFRQLRIFGRIVFLKLLLKLSEIRNVVEKLKRSRWTPKQSAKNLWYSVCWHSKINFLSFVLSLSLLKSYSIFLCTPPWLG